MNEFTEECKRCGCLFVPGGRETTDICAGCYKAENEELKLEIDMSQSDKESMEELIQQIREGIQEIYSMRGEDQLVAKICSPLIDKTRLPL